ncbi:MAG TPA: isoprenylcysteine carboxylmethyltransferase family protein [Candidatus Angelobacter sp.]|nr:isoprenylcysteine carboxylmethyltransferase family protein [Candidatus Angelobacter sp.]
MKLIHYGFFPSVWTTFAVYWIVSAARVKRIKESEPRSARFVHLALSFFVFVMTFSPWFHAGPLGWRVLPANRIAFAIGAVILVAGLGFAVWARIHLGQNWSATVTLKEGHRLIRTGPYRLVRHPIYTGIITGLAGTAVAFGELRGVIAVVLLTVVYLFKSRREERFMVKEFGDEYVQYQKEVGALLPFA